MKNSNSNIVSTQEYRINKNYYSIGLIIGALRAELENGTVDLESAYNLLTEGVKASISNELACVGGAR